MQSPIFCATCAAPLEFKVPELTDARWFVRCAACGKATALKPELGEPGELASFNAAGVYRGPDPPEAEIPMRRIRS